MPSLKYLKTTVAALAVLTGVAVTAHADVHGTGGSGYWEEMQGTNSVGSWTCGVSTQSPTSIFMLKMQSDADGHMHFDMGKQGWDIPIGQSITVVFQIDSAPSFTLRAIGDRTANGYSLIEVPIAGTDPSPISGNKLYVDVLNLMRNGTRLRVSFPNGDEPDWTLWLNGFSGAMARMDTCISRYFPRSTAPTQPYATVQRTQPF
jgi:hypothetical protein